MRILELVAVTLNEHPAVSLFAILGALSVVYMIAARRDRTAAKRGGRP